MSNSFEMAWGIVKGQSSDFEWFKPSWERMTLNERKRREMGRGDNYGAGLQWAKRGVPTRRESELDVWRKKPRSPYAMERGLEQDIEEDASTNPNPAINDALRSIGESPTMPIEYRQDIQERR